MREVDIAAASEACRLLIHEGGDYANQAVKPSSRDGSATIPQPLPTPPHQSGKRKTEREKSKKLLRNTWSRNRLKNLSKGVSRPFFPADFKMLLVSSVNCYISFFQDGLFITIQSLARCPQPGVPSQVSLARCMSLARYQYQARDYTVMRNSS